MGHLMTKQVGDDGFVCKLHVQILAPNFVGDTTWVHGRVTRKYVENGLHEMDYEMYGENQRGNRNTQGWGSAILPSKQ